MHYSSKFPKDEAIAALCSLICSLWQRCVVAELFLLPYLYQIIATVYNSARQKGPR